MEKERESLKTRQTEREKGRENRKEIRKDKRTGGQADRIKQIPKNEYLYKENLLCIETTPFQNARISAQNCKLYGFGASGKVRDQCNDISTT